MPDWPTLERVDDRRYAHALLEGDATDVAHVYSGYAEPLYDYCHALLRDQEEASAALHDTFVAAAAHISRLSEPERFRSWMYALARNEAVRRLNDPERPLERREAPEVDGAFLGEEELARRQEGRELMHSALSGLSGRQRETVDLMLRHRLEPADIAGVLGLSLQEATDLAAEARGRLEEALSAAAIARTGTADCPSVAALMDSGSWPLTPALSRKLIRHIESCPTCGERRKRKVATTRLIETLPVAQLPPELQRSVLTTVTSPDLSEERAAIASGAEPLDESGWPVPVGGGEQRLPSMETMRHRAMAVWPVAVAAVMVMVIGSVLIWLPGASDRSSAQSKSTPGAGAPDASQSPDESPSELDTPSPDTSESPTTTPTPTPTPTTSTPTPKPTTKSPTPSQTPRPLPPVPGRLKVVANGCTGVEVASGKPATCTITVRAVGGPVKRWSASASGGGVTVSGGGALSKGATAAAQVTISDSCTTSGPGAGGVSFSPQGAAAVTWTCTAPAPAPDPQEPAAADPSNPAPAVAPGLLA